MMKRNEELMDQANNIAIIIGGGTIRIGQSAATWWKKRYQELVVAFKRKHGHCNEPSSSGSLGN